MFLSQFLLCLSFLLGFASSKPLGKTIAARQAPNLPPCGETIAWVKNGYTYFDAHYAYTCLRSVTFNSDVATRFLRYYNTTLQFHAPLDTLGKPPAGYRQPAVDLVQGLRGIQGKIDAKQYTNQYQFEADIQRLIAQAHDPHVQLNAGILAAFSFASPEGIVAASIDGKEIPGIYIDRDVIYSQLEGWTPSPIAKINNEDPVKFLMRYADENSASYLEPHAEWNSLMESPVADILSQWSAFRQGTVYPGQEDAALLVIELKNGTKIEDTWSAVYRELQDTGPLSTAGDFYNYFVLGRLPANWKTAGQWWPQLSLPENQGDNSPPEPVSPFTTKCNQGGDEELDIDRCQRSYAAFPRKPDVIQGDLDDSANELITGYILKDISTGVLSIPSFDYAHGGYDSFRTAVQDFISEAQNKTVKRVVIDVQQNNGGSSLRAYDTFKLFFPDIEPYGASRTRKHELANVLGTAYTEAFKQQHLDEDYAANEWVISNRIHADQNTRFDSWKKYFTDKGGYSEPQKYNLSDIDFDLSAFSSIPWGYDPETADELSGQPFAADDIVILTDGLCGSACSLFVEFMSHQAGVRTIAVGGRPETGPMQAVSGSRAAAAYTADQIDTDIETVNGFDAGAFSKLPRRNDTGMWTNYAGISIRTQVRKNDDTPLHFQFQAADCRIFFTLKNVYNTTRLWHDAVKATWDDTSLCVKDSTGYPSLRNKDSDKTPPAKNQTKVVVFDVNPDPITSDDSTFHIKDGGDLVDRSAITYEACPAVQETTATASDFKCMYMDIDCPAKSKKIPAYTVAVPIDRQKCRPNLQDGCRGAGTCAPFPFDVDDSKAYTNGKVNAVAKVGYCQNRAPSTRKQWCVADVAATESKKGYLDPKTFKCNGKLLKDRTKWDVKDRLVTKDNCFQRMRIFQKQTFATWTFARKDGAVEKGTCVAYTCKAPVATDLVKKEGAFVYYWPTEFSSQVLKGIGA